MRPQLPRRRYQVPQRLQCDRYMRPSTGLHPLTRPSGERHRLHFCEKRYRRIAQAANRAATTAASNCNQSPTYKRKYHTQSGYLATVRMPGTITFGNGMRVEQGGRRAATVPSRNVFPSRYRDFRAGEVVLGDRAYATARGIHAVRQADAHVIARFNPGNLRTCDGRRKRIYLAEKEAEIPPVGEVEEILIPVPPRPTKSHKIWKSEKAIAWIPARAVAARTRAGEVIWILTGAGRSNCSPSGSNRCFTWISFPRARALPPKVGCWRASSPRRCRSGWCSLLAHFPPGATNCDPAEQNPRTHSPWSRSV